jgi:phosphoserine aminotransferase
MFSLLEVSKHAPIYAGAQKNLVLRVTLVIIREDAPRSQKSLPTMLNYAVQAERLDNTPPTSRPPSASSQRLIAQGGLPAIAAVNERKAAKPTRRSTALASTAAPPKGLPLADERHLPLGSEELEKAFVKESTAAGLDGLKGHRSVGGMRASIYNAFPEQGIDALVAFMREFEAKRG